uniref:Uncharacterized protein LOC111106143 n=1 Tax=Crassostrea virginica TaxID=6565 RepID=A0A8B8AZ15_CRAVI|nr:uncharacterized protein LOC111106143 [Crassostrea virginica]
MDGPDYPVGFQPGYRRWLIPISLLIVVLFHGAEANYYKYYSQRRYSTGSSTPEGTAILIGVVVGIIAFISAISLSIWCCVHRAKQRARLLQRAEIARARGVAIHTQGAMMGYNPQQSTVYSNPAFNGGAPYGQPPPLYSDPYPSMPPVDGGGAIGPPGYGHPGFSNIPPIWNKRE